MYVGDKDKQACSSGFFMCFVLSEWLIVIVVVVGASNNSPYVASTLSSLPSVLRGISAQQLLRNVILSPLNEWNEFKREKLMG